MVRWFWWIASRRLTVDSRQSAAASNSFSEVFNVAFGGNTTLNDLYLALRNNLAKFDPEIASINAIYGPERAGDIPHSMASIDKAKVVLGYDPEFDAVAGFEKACRWYFENLKE